MKTLFIGEGSFYTGEALSITRSVCDVCKPIMDEWVQQGYSPREIAYTMTLAITDLSLDVLLGLK